MKPSDIYPLEVLHSPPMVNHLTSVTSEEQIHLDKLLSEYPDVLGGKLGQTDLVEHEIILKDPTPFKRRPYKQPPPKAKALKKMLGELEEAGIIRKSNSQYSSPIILRMKPDGTFRLIVDYRGLNEKTVKDNYPIPRLHALLRRILKARYITTLDILKGYYQVRMKESSKMYTAFSTEDALYEWEVMPFGLCNAPATYQRLMNKILDNIIDDFVYVYIDDLVIFSFTFLEHLHHLRQVFDRLRAAGITVNPAKCQFCRTKVKLLGHVISESGIEKDPSHIKAIQEFPVPSCIKSLRRFLGLAGWCREFIKDFSNIAAPLFDLTKKGVKFNWTHLHQSSFNKIKEGIVEDITLAIPDYDLPFILRTDASDKGLGAVLCQVQNGQE